MRLIDADKFKQQIAAITVADNLPAEKCNAMCRLIDKQPTIGDGDITPEMARAAYNVMRQFQDMPNGLSGIGGK